MNSGLGLRIRAIRQQLGLSMEDFIERIDNKPGKGKSGTVNNWESGKNAPNKRRLKKIAELGGVSVDFLLHGDASESLANTKSLIDKAIKDASSLTDAESQELNEQLLNFRSGIMDTIASLGSLAQKQVKQEQLVVDKNPYNVMDWQTYADFLSLLNLIRLKGSEKQQVNFATIINGMFQIANGNIEYDKQDVLNVLDPLLSSFPVDNKDSNSSKPDDSK